MGYPNCSFGCSLFINNFSVDEFTRIRCKFVKNDAFLIDYNLYKLPKYHLTIQDMWLNYYIS